MLTTNSFYSGGKPQIPDKNLMRVLLNLECGHFDNKVTDLQPLKSHVLIIKDTDR